MNDERAGGFDRALPEVRATARRALLLSIAAALVLGCASTPEPDDGLHPDPEKIETWGAFSAQDVVYPERIGDFTLVESEAYADPRFGVGLKYVDDSLRRALIDLYVYPITKQERASLAHVLEWELRSVAQGVAYVTQQQGHRLGEPTSFPFGHSTADLPRGLGLVVRIHSLDDEFLSYGFIAVRDHRFFKMRITVPAEEIELMRDDYFQEVVDVLYPAVHLRGPAEPPDLSVQVYRDAFLAPQHESCNLAGWMVYGIEMLEQIRAGNYLDTFERERAARKRALDFWNEAREGGEGCASDPLEAMWAAQAAGFLDEYVFEAYSRGQWPEPEGIDLEAWSRWSEENLEAHDPIVNTGVAVDWKEPERDEGEGKGEARAEGESVDDRP